MTWLKLILLNKFTFRSVFNFTWNKPIYYFENINFPCSIVLEQCYLKCSRGNIISSITRNTFWVIGYGSQTHCIQFYLNILWYCLSEFINGYWHVSNLQRKELTFLEEGSLPRSQACEGVTCFQPWSVFVHSQALNHPDTISLSAKTLGFSLLLLSLINLKHFSNVSWKIIPKLGVTHQFTC